MVFFEGVAGGQEEDGFNQQESGIYPVDLALGLDVDSVADPGDGSGHEHVRVLCGPTDYAEWMVLMVHILSDLTQFGR